MKSKVNILNNQSLADIAIQKYGNTEAVFDLAITNGKSITDEINAGDELLITGKPLNKVIARHYKENNIKPATGINTPEPDGIGYMSINIDFTVS